MGASHICPGGGRGRAPPRHGPCKAGRALGTLLVLWLLKSLLGKDEASPLSLCGPSQLALSPGQELSVWPPSAGDSC